MAYDDLVRVKCPECPDGQVWTEKGPTGETCPQCNGEAFIWVTHDDARHDGKGKG